MANGSVSTGDAAVAEPLDDAPVEEERLGGDYARTSFGDMEGRIDPARFAEPGYSATLREMIARVIAAEAPIRDDILVERIARAHGFRRSGRVIRDRVMTLARAAARDTSAGYDPSKRGLYSLFHQLSKLTRERGALFHDDRADALEGAVRYWQALIAQDQDRAVQLQREREFRELMADPLGRNRFNAPAPGGTSLFSKYLRR